MLFRILEEIVWMLSRDDGISHANPHFIDSRVPVVGFYYNVIIYLVCMP
jgi:hypothetical protein